MFLRRLGTPESASPAGHTCPDILELNDGNFAVIGLDITNEAQGKLPEGCGCGAGERIVRIPRKTLVCAKQDIPAQV